MQDMILPHISDLGDRTDRDVVLDWLASSSSFHRSDDKQASLD